MRKKRQEVFYLWSKHVILWSAEGRTVRRRKDRRQGRHQGRAWKVWQARSRAVVEVHVNINGLPSSTADLMLDTTFESAEALKGYSVHPAHVAVADSKVRPYTKARFCLDYEI